jgi:hypothetical protein
MVRKGDYAVYNKKAGKHLKRSIHALPDRILFRHPGQYVGSKLSVYSRLRFEATFFYSRSIHVPDFYIQGK